MVSTLIATLCFTLVMHAPRLVLFVSSYST